MCVYSMVHDHFVPKFPPQEPKPYVIPDVLAPWPPPGILPGSLRPTVPTQPSTGVIISAEEAEALRKLIAEFRLAAEAAKTVDRLTGQPDCLDPAKDGLEQRVADLEKRLDAIEKWKSA